MATTKSKGGLGKGLNALIEEATVESGTMTVQEELPLKDIQPNPDQPRENFDEAELADLADSIKQEGLLQPIIVRKKGQKYQIVAGERRWNACKLAKLDTVPVRILDMDDEQTLRVALIENLQRSDLNAIEEARGLQDLMKSGGLTQSELATAVSKSRSAIANSLRLLDLPEEVQKLIYDGELTAGHARAVLSVPDEEKRIQLAQKIAKDSLSVREAESLARLYAAGDMEPPKKVPTPRSFKVVAKELRGQLNAPVHVKNSRGKNRIEIEFQDEEDLQRIYRLIAGVPSSSDAA
ncbi:MAG: ParB/RepB/Spo0J family partition protein [Coriobacteriaceae bacterium]|nr:ParB/RepB/Spo0J family partition protein [Coriobacteriaceae bacterium]